MILLALAGCTVQDPPQEGPAAPSPVPQTAIIPGQAVVLVRDDQADSFGLADLAGLPEELGIRSAERVFADAGPFEARHRAAGLHRWYRISYDRRVGATKAQADLAGVDGIEAVEIPRRKVRHSYFNDKYAYYQWHLQNDGSRGVNFQRGIDVNVEPVWRNFTTGSREVVVAVIDGGVDLAHEDLGGVVLTPREGTRNFLPDYEPDQIPADEHGTHVAGIIGAVNDNGIGVSSIAGGSGGKGGVRVMSCVIFGEDDDAGGSGDEDAEALVWAADHGAVIANNSWGYLFDSEAEAEQGARIFREQPSALKTAIDYFIDYAGTDESGRQTGPMRGGLVLFASGNSGWAHDAPSEYERVVAVGAFGPDGKMPRYSNYGPWVDILAPGGSDSDEEYEEFILSCVPDNMPGYAPYDFFSGTSMACPNAAGVAALIVSHFGGPGFTNEDLKERLLGGARTGVIDQQGRPSGGGKVDAAGSFDYVPDPGDAGDITITTDYTGDYRFKSHEQATLTYKIQGNERSKIPVTVETTCPAVTASCNLAQAQLYIDALRADPGIYTATVRVGDAAHRQVSFTILENHAPQLVGRIGDQILNAASSSLLTLDLNDYFTDPDGEVPGYEVVLADEDLAAMRLSGSTLSFTPQGYGLSEVRVTARDARRASVTTSFRLLARNAYQDLDVYPNPVSDYLYVRPGKEAHTSATLYSRSGAQVLSTSANAGPFRPLQLDVTTLPAGTYTLQVVYDGQQEAKTIVKL